MYCTVEKNTTTVTSDDDGTRNINGAEDGAPGGKRQGERAEIWRDNDMDEHGVAEAREDSRSHDVWYTPPQHSDVLRAAIIVFPAAPSLKLCDDAAPLAMPADRMSAAHQCHVNRCEGPPGVYTALVRFSSAEKDGFPIDVVALQVTSCG